MLQYAENYDKINVKNMNVYVQMILEWC